MACTVESHERFLISLQTAKRSVVTPDLRPSALLIIQESILQYGEILNCFKANADVWLAQIEQ